VPQNPPRLREHGWDVTPIGDFRQTAIGLVCDRLDFRHLRLSWNGHLEFWTQADDESFHWDEAFQVNPPWHILFPYAIIESAESFTRLAREVFRVADYHGELRFCLGLYNIRGQYLLPGTPNTLDYMLSRGQIGRPGGLQPFTGQHLLVNPVTTQTEELPNAVAWGLTSQVYYGFAYTDDQIPLFDAEHRCALGQNPMGGGDT